MEISFIVINYNTSDITLKCIQSIKEYVKDFTYEIILIDNKSGDKDREHLKSLISKEIILIESPLNYGFSIANMLGANIAKGEYLCFLNSDIELLEDCITPLIDYIKNNNNIGCITPQQYKNGKIVPAFNHCENIRKEIFGKKMLEFISPKQFPKRKNKLHTEPFKVIQINGCFMLFRKDIFFKIKGFDINLFLYYEEMDIGYKLKRLGYESIVYPKCKFNHIHKASSGSSKVLTKELYISKLYCYKKYHNFFLYNIYKIIIIIKTIFKPSKWFVLPYIIEESLSSSMRHS